MKPTRKPTVALGLLGPTLDAGEGTARWERWRPTVSVCQHEDLLIDRFEVLYQHRFEKLARRIKEDIASVSPETEVVLHGTEWRDPWDFQEVYAALHDFTRRYPFRPEREDYLVHITTGTHVAQICLFLLTESRHLPAALLQTSPPPRRKHSPTGVYQIIDLDLSRYDRIASRFEDEQRESLSFLKSGIETRNARFNALIEQIEQVASRSIEPILLTGPTGAGKSHLARRIFELKSSRRLITGPFVEINCATLRGDAAMSALFGHVKGSFTGAERDRPGLLRTANEGLIFLDEIGELGIDEQAMLLRAVEEKSFLPVGADEEVTSNFQLIAGTNRDLFGAVDAGTFREDLLARINLWTFALPGLRERLEDIEPNLQYELERQTGQTGKRTSFNKEARERFLAFAVAPEALWSANFRDLSAALTRMSTRATSGRINVDVVDEEIERLRKAWHRRTEPHCGADLEALLGSEAAATLDRFDRVQLSDVVSVCRQCRSLSEAGRQLFAASRQRKKIPNDADRLRKYLGRFGMSWDDVREQ